MANVKKVRRKRDECFKGQNESGAAEGGDHRRPRADRDSWVSNTADLSQRPCVRVVSMKQAIRAYAWFNKSFDSSKQTPIMKPFITNSWGVPMFIRAYLRASTDDQDATRAKDQLRAFAAERGLTVAAWYVENESGAKLDRPELFRLIADAQAGDVLLIEQVDRLSRLKMDDWQRLKGELTARRIRVVALARISHSVEAHRGANQRKLLCRNDFCLIQGAPRCRRSVAQSSLILEGWKAAWWKRPSMLDW